MRPAASLGVSPRSAEHAYPLRLSNGDRLLALRSIVGISGKDPATRTTWIHVGYTGEWNGHGEGPFKLNAADLKSCVAAFDAQVNPISSDYEHASLVADGQPKPAAMWTQQLRTDGRDLFALVEFTERAASLVRSGEYRFCSGVFAFGVPDRVAGDAKRWPCVLRSIALTNDPFLDGQKPIALTASKGARALGGSMAATKITKADILAGLKQIDGDELNPAQLEALLAAIAAMAAAKDPKTGEVEEAEEAPASADAVTPPAEEPALAADPEVEGEKPLSVGGAPALAAEPPPAAPAAQADADGGAMVGAKLIEASGLDGAALLAAIETNLDAVVAALRGSGGQVADLTAAASGGSIAALSARLKVFEDEKALALKAKRDADAVALKASRKAEVDALVTDGRILPAQVAVFADLYETAPASYRALTASLPKGSAFPVGVDSALAGTDPNPKLVGVVDESRPDVIALRRMYVGKPKETADAAVIATFGHQVG